MNQIVKFLLASVIVASCTSFTSAQEDTLSPAPIPAGAFAAFPDDATVSVKAFRDEIARSIVEAAEKSDKLTRLEKRRIQRVMKGGWFNDSRREQIISSVAQKLHSEQMIVVMPDGVQAAVDWDAVLNFIEKLIPLILQIVSLFGV
jgi:hypothetical protein